MRIEKLGSNGEPIKGALFKAEFFDSNSADMSKRKKIWYLETDANGEILLDDAHIARRSGYSSDSFYMHKGNIVIPIDCYIQFTEITTPAEYILDSTPFGMSTGVNDTLYRRVYNPEVPCEVKLKKKDSDGNALIGVEFELKFLEAAINENVNKDPSYVRALKVGESMKGLTDTNGEVRFTNLAQGKYQITETKTTYGNTLLKDPIIVNLPVTMTAAEAAAYGNVDYTSAKEDVDYTGKWYFYNCAYEVTNHVHFEMPMSGSSGTWKFGFIGFGTIAVISTGLIFNDASKKKKKKYRKMNKI